MNRLHIPETFIGVDQDEMGELHSHDRFLDAAQELGELSVSPLTEGAPLPRQSLRPEHSLAA